jgi:Barstar (barnase inhibitor)
VIVIDGSAFTDFEGFGREFSKHLDNYEWRGNLDAFNDILRGGFGTPEGGFVLRWERSDLSRLALGYPATALWLEHMLATCHHVNHPSISARLDAARRGQGPTLYDEIIDILAIHGTGGQESEDGVELDFG